MGVQTSMRIVALAGWWCCWPPAGRKAQRVAGDAVGDAGHDRARRPRRRRAPSTSHAARPRLAGAGVALRTVPLPDRCRPGPAPWRRPWAAPCTVAGDPPQSWTFAPATPDGGRRAARTDPQADRRRRVWTAIGSDPTTLDDVGVGRRPDRDRHRAARRRAVAAAVRRHRRRPTARSTAASGHLATADGVGDQPRIGTAAALGLLAAASAGDDRGEQQPSLRPDPTPAVPAAVDRSRPTAADRGGPAAAPVDRRHRDLRR